MFTIEEPKLIHEIRYRTSGSSKPRPMVLPILTVRYEAEGIENVPFLVTADLQGREIPQPNRLLGEQLADEVMAFQKAGKIPALDLCFLCGDFYDYPDLKKTGGTGDVTDAVNALSKVAPKTFLALGNHDHITEDALSPSVRVLDKEIVDSGPFTIGGVSGIIGNPRRNNRKTDQDFLKAVDMCSTSRVDVLMLHSGPQGANLWDKGEKRINDLLMKRSDLLVLFGHCHWPAPFHKEGRNLFCNVDARAVIFMPR